MITISKKFAMGALLSTILTTGCATTSEPQKWEQSAACSNITHTTLSQNILTAKHSSTQLTDIKTCLGTLTATPYHKLSAQEKESEIILSALLVEHNAQTMADKIIERLENRKDKSKPVIVLFGQVHPIAADYLQEMHTVQKVTYSGYTAAVGMEVEKNVLENLFNSTAQQRHPNLDADRAKKTLAQHANQLTKMQTILAASYKSAPIATHLRIYFLSQALNTQVYFDDLPRTVNFTLDPNNADVHALATTYYPDLLKTKASSANEKNAMHLRNIYIAQKAEKNALKSGVDVYFLTLGNAHVAGDIKIGSTFSESVLHELNKLGYNPLAFPTFSPLFTRDDVPEEAKSNPSLNSSIDLPGRHFSYISRQAKIDAKNHGTTRYAAYEEDFFRAAMPLIGMNPKIFADMSAEKEKSRALFLDLYSDVVEETEANAPEFIPMM